jgi:hypothetical protein
MLMNLPTDPLREAILLELNRAIWTLRAQGASFEAVRQEYGLSKEALHLIAERDGRQGPRKCAADSH